MKELIKQYKGLDKRFYIIALTVLINCSGSFVGVFLSLYLVETLGIKVVTAGSIITGYTFTHIIGSLLGGYLADKYNKKRIMVFGQLVMGICFIVSGFLLKRLIAILFIYLANFFDGITDPARNAFEVDITKPSERQVAFSLLYQSLNVGFAIGPVIAGFLYHSYQNWLFWGNGLAQIISIMLVIFFVPNVSICAEYDVSPSEKAFEGNVWKALLSKPQLLLFALSMIFISFSYKQISFVLPIQFNSFFTIEGTKLYGYIASLNAVIVIIFNPIVLSISKKSRELDNILLAILLYAVAFTLFGFANKFWQFGVLTIIYTIGEILLNNNSKSYQNNNTPVNFRGRFNAVFPLFKNTGTMLGPIVGGFLVSKYSYRASWLISGIMVLCAFGLNAIAKKQRRK